MTIKIRMKFLSSLLLLFIDLSLSGQIITTVAGNGTYGNSGTGGPATSAQLAWPIGVTTDISGNLYIADHDNNQIKKVDGSGIITVFAGTGVLGYSGDGGPATAAKLYHPTYLTTDNLGNLYFADQNADVIRKINSSGIITSITNNNPGACSGDGGPLILARFTSISGLHIDNTGNLYITDYGCSVVRKVNTAGIITTIAGTGTAGYSGDGGPATSAMLDAPYEVVVRNGYMYIPDARNRRIRVVDPAGIINTYAGTGVIGYSGDGGPAILATMGWPWHICMDAPGNLYISDGFNEVVRKVDVSGIITTFAGNGTSGYSGDGGPAILAEMIDVVGVACDAGNNIYIVNRTFPNVVRKVNYCLTSTITSNPANVILCNSGNANFSITASNANTYQWQENQGTNWNNLTDNATYSGSTTTNLTITGATTSMNGYQYRCKVTNSCGDTYSLFATLTVNTLSAPAISITTATTNICVGTNTVFTASPFNGGSTPVYQWRKNGSPVGTNNNMYTDNTLINGDIISCQLTSNSSCVTTNTATSNNIMMTVNPLLTPSITISVSQNNFCYGTTVTFSSISVNQGINPVYQWKKNGINVGTNASGYTDNTLQNTDIISCVLTSSENCVTTSSAASNGIIMNVTPLVTPAITISASRTSICKGDPVIFNAIHTNGGTLPVFQWKKNGINVGANSPFYTDNSILNGDIISCILTSNANCLSVPIAPSNLVSITVNPDPVITLDKSTSICTGNSKILDAGIFNSYLWNDGSTNRTLTINTPGTYYVRVFDMNGCTGTDTSILTTLLPLPKNFLPADSAICTYGSLMIKADPSYLNYLWSNGSGETHLTVALPGLYWLEVTDNNQCKGRDSITIIPKQCFKGLFFPNTFTPNGDSKNDLFKPVGYGTLKQFELRILNRYGETVFITKNITTGWDGKFKGTIQNTGVFTWICTYQIDQQMVTIEKGTVLLLR